MNTIENQYWSLEEKLLLTSIFQSWNLTNEKQQILRQQIKQMKKYPLFLNLIFYSNKNWETLQVQIRENQQQLNDLDMQTVKQEQLDCQLLEQFQTLNQKDFTEEFNLVMTCFQILKSDLNTGSSLDKKNMYFTNFKAQTLQIEDLIQLCIGVKQIFSYFPREVQLMSVVILFNHQSKGRLAQIYTGEGKTLIVAMLAVLLCKKKNCNVDIVTSSSVLAERDSKDYAQFYKYFELSVSHNIHKDQIIEDGVLPCYNCQIIYGDESSFQAGILRHEYYEQEIMGNRKQQYAIIDEVDSMLIEGMLELSKVLQLIWQEICKVEPYISTDFKIMIIKNENLYSVDLEEYLEKTIDIQLQTCLNEFIPNFRKKYIQNMKKKWIKTAIAAKYYLKNERDYVVLNGLIRIVDYQNTGVIKSGNTQWEKGLHQFLQLKHNVNITPLSITTNYLSNVTFFKRYGSSLLGLTGTLGSRNTQNLLAKQYNVDFIFVPPFKQRNLREESSIALLSEGEWLKQIAEQVQFEIDKNRSVLIINRTIQEVEKIRMKILHHHYNIIKYTDDSQVISKDIGPRVIIIATNLAGRGTDFITDQELERNGGLHVIMSFLPQSIRTQEQGFGRTCRQGKNGSAQLIVHFSTNLYINPSQQFKNDQEAIEYYKKQNQVKVVKIDVVKFFRDKNEKYYMEQIEREMEKLEYEDQCFERFCKIAKSQANIKENREKFRFLEEAWGLFLEINEERGIRIEEIEDFLNRKENRNPKYQVIEAMETEDVNRINEGVQQYNDPFPQQVRGQSQWVEDAHDQINDFETMQNGNFNISD